MEHISATDARKRWSEVLDMAVRQKPQFIRRTRDHLPYVMKALTTNDVEEIGISIR